MMPDETLYTGWEFKIIHENATNTQRILNQWRHTYYLNIIKVEFDGLVSY